MGMPCQEITFNDAAKLLDIKGIGQNKLIQILYGEKIIYRQGDHYLPMQKYINAGYFKVKQRPIPMGDDKKLYIQIYVTQEGLRWLGKKLSQKGYVVQGMPALG